MSITQMAIKTTCEDFCNDKFSPEHNPIIMNKLLSFLKVSSKNQKDLFINLGYKGISKILYCLKDENVEMRKLAFRLILALLNQNDILQNLFCEKFNFTQVGPVICLNWFPRILKDNIKFDGKMLNTIKVSTQNLSSQHGYWLWPFNNKYTNENLPDPQRYLIGLIYSKLGLI
jgi:hypothetical protein